MSCQAAPIAEALICRNGPGQEIDGLVVLAAKKLDASQVVANHRFASRIAELTSQGHRLPIICDGLVWTSETIAAGPGRVQCVRDVGKVAIAVKQAEGFVHVFERIRKMP